MPTAQVHPPLAHIRPTTAGGYAELELLRALADGLGEGFHLFHGVNWTALGQAGDQHGELDIVVVNTAGHVALLEVKAGEVAVEHEKLWKDYGGHRRDIAIQTKRQHGSVMHRLRHNGLEVYVMHLLVLPHMRVEAMGTIAYPRERIADALDCQNLAGHLLRTLGRGTPEADRQARVCAFFANALPVQPEVSSLASTLQRQARAQADGLATWVPRIHAPSGVVRVQGTAGSGKTQLALALLRQARSRGQAAAYVCFNRPLADRMQLHVPPGVEVASFHQLCWQAANPTPAPHTAPDYAALERGYGQATRAAGPDLDLLVIDELQDLQPDWIASLAHRVRSDGQLMLLDDPDQHLYDDRHAVDIPGAVLVTCDDNHRSPRQIVATVNALHLTARPIRACSPLEGRPPDIRRYDPAPDAPEGQQLLAQTVAAVRHCQHLGHPLDHIVVLCWRGREQSRLLGLDRLGHGLTLARYTGQYDAQGVPIWRDGDLRIDTLRRFKGQSAPAVVLTEVDFDTLTPLNRRLLFVGLTRAQMHVEWVLSAAAERAVATALR